MPSALSENSSFSTVSAILVIVFLILAILVGVKWYPFVVLICVSLMTWISSLMIGGSLGHLNIFLVYSECLCRSFDYIFFLIGLFVFYYWVVRTMDDIKQKADWSYLSRGKVLFAESLKFGLWARNFLSWPHLFPAQPSRSTSLRLRNKAPLPTCTPNPSNTE